MPRKKKKTAEEREKEQTQIIEEDSEEARTAAVAHQKEQTEAMADLLDDADDDQIKSEAGEQPADLQEQEPAEKPAETEQESQPQAEVSEQGKQAKTEDQPPDQKPELEADVPDTEAKPGQEPAETKPTDKKTDEKTEFVSGDRFGDYSVEVVTDEGAKSVPLTNLVTTYQQHKFLQRKFVEVKPLIDLAQKAQVPVENLWGLIQIGAQEYAKQQNIVTGAQPPVSDTRPAGQIPPAEQAGTYQGPFADEEQDAYYKEVDPDHHAAMHRMFAMATGNAAGGGGKLAQLEQEIYNLRNQLSQPQQLIQTAGGQDGQAENEAQKAFDNKIMSWSGDHTDYFTAPNIGEARLNAFKNFILQSHAKSGLKIKDLTPDFLAAEFARFDPRYNLEYMRRLAGSKAQASKNESGMFAEGSGIRSTAEPLDDQQKHMADLL